MPRTQAPEYEERRERIVARAADLYAERGFLGASIADLAEACQTSKSLIYHYYESKEAILFDVMHEHVKALLDTAEAIVTGPLSAREKLAAMTSAFFELYAGAAARHKVLLNDLQHLPPGRRSEVIGIQRKLIEHVERLVGELLPSLRESALLRPAAMLYFGMINWTHTWLDPAGRASPQQIAELATSVFLDGIAQRRPCDGQPNR